MTIERGLDLSSEDEKLLRLLRSSEKIKRLMVFLKEQSRQTGRPISTKDIDGVEIETMAEAVLELNDRHGTSFAFEHIREYWGFSKLLETIPGISNVGQYAMEIVHSARVLLDAKPVPGSRALSYYLFEEGVAEPRITARPGNFNGIDVAALTRIWYSQKMPWVDSALINIGEGSGIGSDSKVRRIV